MNQKSRFLNATAIWDRLVLAAFVGCLLLLAHALLGLGERPLSENSLVTSMNLESNSTGGDAWGSSMALGNIKDTPVAPIKPAHEYDCHHEPVASVSAINYLVTPTPTEPPLPVGTVTLVDLSYEDFRPKYDRRISPVEPIDHQDSSASILRHRNYDFALDLVLDADDYDNDGQPFALKVHLRDI